MTGMTQAELLTLPLVVNLETAGRAWGMSRSRVYEARGRGELPFPVVVVCGRAKVTRAALLRSLDVDESGLTTLAPRDAAAFPHNTDEAGPASPATVTTRDEMSTRRESDSHIRAV